VDTVTVLQTIIIIIIIKYSAAGKKLRVRVSHSWSKSGSLVVSYALRHSLDEVFVAYAGCITESTNWGGGWFTRARLYAARFMLCGLWLTQPLSLSLSQFVGVLLMWLHSTALQRRPVNCRVDFAPFVNNLWSQFDSYSCWLRPVLNNVMVDYKWLLL